MNSAVITKIEYRLKTSPDYIDIPFIGFSANLNKIQEETTAGTRYTSTLGFKISKCSPENDEFLTSLSAQELIWRVTDANEKVHYVGSDTIPARLNFTKTIDGQPGNYNGYQLTVKAKSI
jgi:hypothetical protein